MWRKDRLFRPAIPASPGGVKPKMARTSRSLIQPRSSRIWVSDRWSTKPKLTSNPPRPGRPCQTSSTFARASFSGTHPARIGASTEAASTSAAFKIDDSARVSAASSTTKSGSSRRRMEETIDLTDASGSELLNRFIRSGCSSARNTDPIER